MSDYLGRLVERSLGLAEPVRPRPVALFEAPAPSPALPAEPDAGDAAPGTAPPPSPRVFPREPQPLVPPPAPRPPSLDASTFPAPAPAEPLRPLAAEPPEERRAAAADPAPPAPSVPRAARRAAEPARPRERRSAPPPPAAPTILHQVERERLHPVPALRPPPRQVVVHPVARETTIERRTVIERAGDDARREPTVPQPRTVVERELRRVEMLRPVPAPREHPAPAAAPRAERERGADAAAPPPAAAPAIHVTIGRLEVRAASHPAPAPRRAREQPAVMSLDDYLRQRASGSKP